MIELLQRRSNALENEITIEQLDDLYKKSNLIAYGRPDQYQMHQNNLARGVAAFLLQDFWKNQIKEKEED